VCQQVENESRQRLGVSYSLPEVCQGRGNGNISGRGLDNVGLEIALDGAHGIARDGCPWCNSEESRQSRASR
jgi:hypothetical protein